MKRDQQMDLRGLPAGLARSLADSERDFQRSLRSMGLARGELSRLAGRMRDRRGEPMRRGRAPSLSDWRGGRHV